MNDDLLEKKLIAQKQLAQKQLKKQLMSIRISAMNILAVREHSIAELRKKLKLKFSSKKNAIMDDVFMDEKVQAQELNNELKAAQIEAVLQQLLDDNLLNESRFAESFIRSRINRGSGPVKIRHELLERKISNELIAEHLEMSYDFWHEHIKTVHYKRFGEQIPDNYKEQNKQSRFLYQRGFSGECIRRFFGNLFE